MRLPGRRETERQRCVIGGRKVYIDVGFDEDGDPGEVWVTMGQDGHEVRETMSCWMQTVSIALRYGVPCHKLVEMFSYTRFEPAGIVQGHPRIAMASSVADLVFRHIGITYLGMDELAQKPKMETTST